MAEMSKPEMAKPEMSRTGKAARNFLFSTIGSVCVYITTFAMQTLFIYYLGAEYNGVKGLFTSILGTLALAELGISTAISFSLYKPLADHDEAKIKALMGFYRVAYRWVALVVAVLGLALIPFLPLIVKGGEGIPHLTLIYVLYLADTVISYLLIYKSTLLEADQKSYLMTNIYTVSNLVIVAVQAVVIVLLRDFILYLVVQIVLGFVSKFIVNRFVDRKYPYLRGSRGSSRAAASGAVSGEGESAGTTDGEGEPQLTAAERRSIFRKLRALLVHKIGYVAITQTDNIIMSGFINITTVGICCNFTMIIRIINELVTSFFVASAPGLGNVIATETMERRIGVFRKYDFLVFVLYGWSAICLYFLLLPFVSLWLGGNMLIDKLSVLLLCVNYYFTGQRISLENTKNAAGVVEQDAPLSIIEAIVNLVVSIVGVKLWGLPGIFVGTLVSSFIPNIGKPIVLYKYVFGRSPAGYFGRYAVRIAVLAICGGAVYWLNRLVADSFTGLNPVVGLLITLALCVVVPFAGLWAVYRRSDEWKYCDELIRRVVSLRKRG